MSCNITGVIHRFDIGAGEKDRLRAGTALVNEYRRRDPGLTVLAAHDPHAATALAVHGKVPHAQR